MAIPQPTRFELDRANTTFVDVASWTQEALQSLKAVNLNAPVRGTSVLALPLDGEAVADGQGITAGEAVRSGHVLRRKTSNRDSLRHRETLLKGKEGSRQRRRWENDRLVGNPHAQPPQPSDWQIQPTHPVHTVPYYLAPLWDAGYAKQNAARKEREQRAKKNIVEGATTETAGKVPKELREKLKRSKAAKGMLQDLEKEVRSFVEKWEIKCQRMEERGIIEPDSEEEDEVVFVGRNGEMHDMPSSPRTSDELLELEREKLVFDSLEGDHGAGFGRWLVHSLGQYYGLKTFSVTVGARREAYVAVKEVKLKTGRRKSFVNPLPRPLWALV